MGLILAILTYPTLFFSAWLLLFLTPAGAMMAFGLVWLFVIYHTKIVDHNCAFLVLSLACPSPAILRDRFE